ncbi:TPA: tyrosine-type recombinase/integrase [Pseudomonas aeruginosa]|uniref:tyrosine-type recombinase/integrase n=1 Tax=Pseudomonas aeruginosa TaxID=287 RepID=UPI001CC0DCB6|nr:site-specific integrase [Pseudomonas aeruginosa]MCT1000412.1 site-specific integrase [Pseudomonas aeruginosa]MCT1025308.1 site-specific integrase [Pseudomonas aeruginosa]MCT1028725.1 site-specific integrase [Pseudomonas aeruginosa]MCT1046972.1 site-specific integrase [Pseudomonas aeruginosa]MCT1285750.1 site-specific integrase [Pseudomonas aeruginosa]
MQAFSIRSFTASDGVEMAVLVDDQGSPLFLPNVYATFHYRDVGSSPATIKKALRALGMAYLWASARKLDLHAAISSEAFLSIEQCEDLAFFLRLDRPSQDHELAVSLEELPSRVVRLEQMRGGFHQKASERTACSAEEGAYRIRIVAAFLEFQLAKVEQGLPRPAPGAAKEKAAHPSIRRLKALIPKVSNADESDALEGMDEVTMAFADEIFDPTSEINPFSTDFIKHRNHLVYRMLSDNGMRRSELRFVQVEDVSYANNRVRIRVSKTQGRTVPISSTTALAFHHFVVEHWSKIPAKQRAHGYLFTTAEGRHICADTINLIFRTARKKAHELPEDFAPHALRRTWNDRFSTKVDKAPPEKRIPKNEEEQMRNRLMGWRKDSQMSARYSRRTIRVKSDQIAEELANEIAAGKKKDNE